MPGQKTFIGIGRIAASVLALLKFAIMEKTLFWKKKNLSNSKLIKLKRERKQNLTHNSPLLERKAKKEFLDDFNWLSKCTLVICYQEM